jgi:hypothetical protein
MKGTAMARNPGHELPAWWQQTRALYCPAAGGAGSALMSFGLVRSDDFLSGFELERQISSWSELPLLLERAQSMGSNVIYLVDYWEGGYHNKGDYRIRNDFGGPEAFTEAVRTVHQRGGRVILYLEAFIVSRESAAIGRSHGPDWAMMNHDGSYQSYPTIPHPYYQMWPGQGSGWSDYLASVAERLIREHDVDGFHLDSYGCQAGWFDHHPKHPEGLEPGGFNAAAVELMVEFRSRIRAAKPDAIVMMEGSDLHDLHQASDGGQDWSFEWFQKKSWSSDLINPVFTADYSLPRMERILASGCGLSLGSWWHGPIPDQSFVSALADVDVRFKGTGWVEQFATREPVRDLWWCYNVLVANGLIQPQAVDIDWLKPMVQPFPFPVDPCMSSEAGLERWRKTVAAIARLYAAIDPEKARTPARYLKCLMDRENRGRLVL